MYRLCINSSFKARHFLIGGDWGEENHPHEHHYKVELRLKGEKLDPHQYLADLVTFEKAIKATVAIFENKLLNELKGFEKKNPSLELFAKNFSNALATRLPPAHLEQISVRLWENEHAWAEYTHRFP